MNTFKDFFMLTEGGAAGHMAHPFDLLSIKTGRDLINFFNTAAKSLQKKPAAVKIDGINASVKLITNEDGSKEFALDRGSSKMEDIKGVTAEKLVERFPEGHGMIEIGKTVLTIFNKTLPIAVDELKKLGMFDNSSIFLNTEYVKGNTNVVGYQDNFLAIHGVNKFFNVRSKIKRTISRSSREVSYNKAAFNSLINKLNSVGKSLGYRVISVIEAAPEKPVTFEDVLNAELTFNYSKDHSETKTMKTWLERCRNPRRGIIRMLDGKRVDPFNKQLYLKILNGEMMDTFIDKRDINAAVCGTIIMHATRILGKKLLDNLKSEIGDVGNQEGIVLRDRRISTIPVKITGEFIVRGLESKFQQR
jgi:hypothetical protein